MIIIDSMAPLVEKKIIWNQFLELPKMTSLKQKRKNMLINERRKNRAELLRKNQKLGKEIKRNKELAKGAKIRQKILSGGQAGL
jgi:hypothetical protein